jgi:hypothetical protein
MAKTIRSACRNKHEDWDGFIASYLKEGTEVVKKIKAIRLSKRYQNACRDGDDEVIINCENEIEHLMGGTNFEHYVG